MMHPILVSLFFVVGLIDRSRDRVLYFKTAIDKEAFLRG